MSSQHPEDFDHLHVFKSLEKCNFFSTDDQNYRSNGEERVLLDQFIVPPLEMEEVFEASS